MTRYISFLWSTTNSSAAARAAHYRETILSKGQPPFSLRSIYYADGIEVFVEKEPYSTGCWLVENGNASGGACILLGTAFSNGDKKYNAFGSSPLKRMPKNVAERAISSIGLDLSKDIWGNYIAFVHTPSQETSAVLRDPTGALPCYYGNLDGLYVFFSDIRDFERIKQTQLSINEGYVFSAISSNIILSQQTGFDEIHKLLQGQRLEIKKNEDRKSLYWNPLDFINQYKENSSEEAAEKLKNSVLYCTASWLKGHEKAIIKLSGGLDSNILLAAINEAQHKLDLTAFHYDFAGDVGNELEIAKESAERCGVEFISDRVIAADFSLSEFENVPKTAEYLYHPATLRLRSLENSVYNDRQAKVLYCGNGGDEVFLQLTSDWMAADYFREHGINLGFLEVVFAAARLSRTSMYRSAKTAVMMGAIPWFARQSIINKFKEYAMYEKDGKRSNNVLASLHPWLESVDNYPPAKWIHALYLSYPNFVYAAPARYWGTNEVSPLYSQPIFEACLSIPSYVLSWEGRDRGLARKAFSDVLHPAVVWREAKAAGNIFYRNLVWHNREYLRCLLLDGMLVQKGFLHRAVLEKALSSGETGDAEVSSCLTLAGVEWWLRSSAAC